MKSGYKFLSRLLCFFQEIFDKLDKTVYCHNSSIQSGVQMDTGKLFRQHYRMTQLYLGEKQPSMHVLTNFSVYDKFSSLANLIIYPANVTNVKLQVK